MGGRQGRLGLCDPKAKSGCEVIALSASFMSASWPGTLVKAWMFPPRHRRGAPRNRLSVWPVPGVCAMSFTSVLTGKGHVPKRAAVLRP